MDDTWGRLEDAQREAIREKAKRLSEAEINKRFGRQRDRVTFRIVRQSERTQAGPLDVARAEGVEASQPFDVSMMAATPAQRRRALDQPEREGYEVAEVTLIAPEIFDYEPDITPQDERAARPIDEAVAELKGYYAVPVAEGEAAPEEAEAETELPPLVDHRVSQSPIKDQGNRGTCVAHASMGLLEAYSHIPDDLSEQYTHYLFNELSGRPHDEDAGLRTTDAAPFLSRADGRVCTEEEWPYIPDQGTIDRLVAQGSYAPPEAARRNQMYGIGAYKIIPDNGLNGESIKNTRYLETLLYAGYNIVVGTWVSWDDRDNNGILDPVLDPSGNPIGRGGHAMLIVGYNRPEEYFIVKNSWTRGWGHEGYAYLHYALARSCFKYGYVVDSVVPAAPTSLPRKLAQAPYNTERIARERLRAAVLFCHTSGGRYAVSEVYSGDNLLLRHLRTYGPGGNLHLQRDSLVIRSSYLADLDAGRETNLDADLWWEGVAPGQSNLVPRNNAALAVAYDLAALDAGQIRALLLDPAPISAASLDYAVVAGITTSNRPFKMLLHVAPDGRLIISYAEVFKADGSRYRYGMGLALAPGQTLNLDTLRLGGGRNADIVWAATAGASYLEGRGSARMALVWSL